MTVQNDSTISSSWIPLPARGQAEHTPPPPDPATSSSPGGVLESDRRSQSARRQGANMVESDYLVVPEDEESTRELNRRSEVFGVSQDRNGDGNEGARGSEIDNMGRYARPENEIAKTEGQGDSSSGTDNDDPVIISHPLDLQSTQTSMSTGAHDPPIPTKPGSQSGRDVQHNQTPTQTAPDPSPHIIHVSLPPALDQEDPIIVSSPPKPIDSAERSHTAVEQDRSGSAIAQRDGGGNNVEVERTSLPEESGGSSIGATKRDGAAGTQVSTNALDSGWILPQATNSASAPSLSSSSQVPLRQPPTLGRVMGPPAPVVPRPISTVGGEEALTAMRAEGSFRRPGVKASTGPGEESVDDVDMLDDGAMLAAGSVAAVGLPRKLDRKRSQTRESGTPARKPSREDLEGSYMTIMAPTVDKATLDPAQDLESPGGEMEILTAPPPRSSSIPGNLSHAALSPPLPSTASPGSPSSSTWPKMQRSSSPLSSPLPSAFEIPPVMIPQHHQQSLASASSSTTSFPSYKSKGREEDSGLPEEHAEKKEGRGTRLRKKTSKLFRMPSKDKDRPKEDGHSSPPLARSGHQAPTLFSRTSTATSASSIVSRSSVGTPTRQRFSTAPPGMHPNNTPSPPPQITMTRPSTHDLISLQRRTSRSSSSSSMDMPLPGRRTSDLAQSASTEKKGRLSLPSMKRTAEPARRRQSSDVASIVSSSIGSLRGHSKAKRVMPKPNASGFASEIRGDHASDAGDSVESLREEEALDDEEDVFASGTGPRPIAARSGTGRPPSTTPSVSASSSFPSRMSSWFTNVMPNAQASTSAGIANPQGLSQKGSSPAARGASGQGNAQILTSTSSSSSPGRRGNGTAASLFNAARQKAVGGMRYLMDVDAQPDGCSMTIWLMGVSHDFPDSPRSSESTEAFDQGHVASLPQAGGSTTRRGVHRRQSSASNILLDKAHIIAAAAFQPSSPSRKGTAGLERADSPGRPSRPTKGKEREAVVWPESFLTDYQSVIWCTYRSQYAPISALPPELLFPNPTSYMTSPLPPLPDQIVPSSQKSGWTWLPSVASQVGLTSDSGWGCMLRTGQSMLANALIRLHLGREFRKPSPPPSVDVDPGPGRIEPYAAYVQILSWFMDDPAGTCPFSVHRMALIGKQLGKEVGEWFGPSTAAGAIRTLTNAFPACGLSVVMATDGVLYRSDVLEASQTSHVSWGKVERQLCLPRSARSDAVSGDWGGQAVLVLAGVRLGLDGVNAVYHDSVKALFTFPQSVGIAGGRPASSYYFIGTQADSLFYLDPHFTRPAIPLRTPEEGRRVIPTSESSATVTSESYKHGLRKDGEGHDQSQADAGSASTIGDSTSSSVDDDIARASRTKWLAGAYTDQQLSTFHCDKVKKMPMSGLDPSMLLGFLCRNEADWDDLVQRLDGLKHKVLSIQSCPPSWAEDDFSDGPSIESFSETTIEDDGIGSICSSSVNGRRHDGDVIGTSAGEGTRDIGVGHVGLGDV